MARVRTISTLILTLTLALSSCREGVRYHRFSSLPQEGWSCRDTLCFVPDSVPADSMQAYFEKYITHVFSWCNTTSLFRETLPRPFVDVRAGDILVHPAQKDENYGHAILIADVAHSPSGRVAVLCLEGNTPAREKHIVRNINLLRNPWFIIDSGDTQIRFIKSRFHSGQLRHYSTP